MEVWRYRGKKLSPFLLPSYRLRVGEVLVSVISSDGVDEVLLNTCKVSLLSNPSFPLFYLFFLVNFDIKLPMLLRLSLLMLLLMLLLIQNYD